MPAVSKRSAPLVKTIATFFPRSVENRRAKLSLESVVFLADLIGEDVAGLAARADASTKVRSTHLQRAWRGRAASRSRERATPLVSTLVWCKWPRRQLARIR